MIDNTTACDDGSAPLVITMVIFADAHSDVVPLWSFSRPSQCASDVVDGWALHVIIKGNHPMHEQFPVHIRIAFSMASGGARQ